MSRKCLPNRRASEVFQFEHANIHYTATVGRFSDGRMAEIFLDHERPNSQIAAHANDAAILASLLLQHDISATTIRHSISGPLAVALALAEGSK